ncbi:phosphoribosylglycinamide formyltransferase [Psychrobium sp. 1_MG-2023]|uniref:phosphoribosylglycinamide formyltransferase n=1 Tax=Psychrobium sp. 1_MG-2023 TaxID=3062624 RepID=UPI000C33BCDC|nr:phosphoribosylglycinamide formyltransferase [Psychrobium sp. 1_MG-2023]MDP2560299.1 phosphoribosylglycinamide formyltransferase [Psychrobium sp. 1_MG-2023]PKF55415.1 phosphoribosylglycinamide formyltransferase [Alteromonadales bacterium alter-6D02]
MSKKIVVLISGNGSNLQAIIDACENNTISGEVAGVVSNRPDVYGLERASNSNIASSVLDHKKFDSREDYDLELIKVIDQYQPDLVVLAGFMRILTPAFVTHYQGRMLNIHPSLLPKYQGLNTHQRAIDAGDSEHGVSVHFVTEELDGGPVILQAKVPVFPEDTSDDLAMRVHEQEHRIYPLVVNWFCQSRLAMVTNGQSHQAKLDGLILSPSGHAVD